jgi:hypothetical protein
VIRAELHGKISSKLKDREDLLTSNVFSFFKYSDREYLKNYFNRLGLSVSLSEAKRANFEFWPRYPDNTEPDLVITCGKYYILFEAKLMADFSPGTLTLASQIDREIKMGSMESEVQKKEFVFIAITAEYYFDKKKYAKYANQSYFHWTNWSAITTYLFGMIEQEKFHNNKLYVEDLYALLVKKRQRGFGGLSGLTMPSTPPTLKPLFYNPMSSNYTAGYSGFIHALADFKKIKMYKNQYKKLFFTYSSKFKIFTKGRIFYHVA